MCVRSWLWGRSVQQGLINTLNDNSNPWHFLEVDRQTKMIKKKPNVGWNMTSKQILLFLVVMPPWQFREGDGNQRWPPICTL